MRVGIPREVKDHEYRVAITPAGVHELTRAGHQVTVFERADRVGGLLRGARGVFEHPGRVWVVQRAQVVGHALDGRGGGGGDVAHGHRW